MGCKSCKSGGGLFAIKEALVPLTLFASTLGMKKKTKKRKFRKSNKSNKSNKTKNNKKRQSTRKRRR
jgi:hypothetical protein